MENFILNEDTFKKIFEVAPTPFIITQASDGKILDINTSFMKLFDYTHDEALSGTTLDLIWQNPKDRENFISILKEKNEVRNMEFKFRKKGGEILTILLSALTTEIDGHTLIISSVFDVTESKLLEEEIKISQQIQQTKVEELERLNKLMVGRELAIIDYKKRIAELEEKLASK